MKIFRLLTLKSSENLKVIRREIASGKNGRQKYLAFLVKHFIAVIIKQAINGLRVYILSFADLKTEKNGDFGEKGNKIVAPAPHFSCF